MTTTFKVDLSKIKTIQRFKTNLSIVIKSMKKEDMLNFILDDKIYVFQKVSVRKVKG